MIKILSFFCFTGQLFSLPIQWCAGRKKPTVALHGVNAQPISMLKDPFLTTAFN